MNPQNFQDLKQEVERLRRELDEVKSQQLRIPLDEASIGTINQALYNQQLDRLTIKDLRYKTLTAI